MEFWVIKNSLYFKYFNLSILTFIYCSPLFLFNNNISYLFCQCLLMYQYLFSIRIFIFR